MFLSPIILTKTIALVVIAYCLIAKILNIGGNPPVREEAQTADPDLYEFLGTMEVELFKNVSAIKETDLGKPGGELKNKAICKACVLSYNLLSFWRRTLGLDRNAIMGLLRKLCATVGKEFPGKDICEALIDLNLDELLHIIDHINIDGKNACGVLLQFYGCRGELPKPWSVNIKGLEGRNERKMGAEGAEVLRILHVTDIHYDPNYTAGSSADCKAPLCCQVDGDRPKSVKERAGYFSDYRKCDISEEFVAQAFRSIREDQKQIDYIYFTGDIISHRLWDTSAEGIRKDIEVIMRLFKEQFDDVRIFPLLGNHDVHPVNLFAPDSLAGTRFSTQWLYDFVADIWKDFLPEGTDLSTIRRGGFYTVKEPNRPRIIALNSNVAYTLNFWILYEDHDFYGQLQWFADTLEAAEANGETVHVLSHVPTGNSDTYAPWATQFQRIMKRYSHIIAGVFVGHMHYDETLLYYDGNTPINVGFNAGSLTPYTDVNPNYRMYTVACDTFDILDFDEYYVNLMRANGEERVVWEKLYSFREEYGLQGLGPESVHALMLRMVRNATLRDVYYKNKVRLGIPSMENGCDEMCHKESLCSMVTNVFGDERMCNMIKRIYVN